MTLQKLALASIIFSFSLQAMAFKVETSLSICMERAELLQKLELLEEAASVRETSYFDDRDQNLYAAGLIIRTRLQKAPEKSDVTVKLRPFDLNKIDSSWLELKGFKCEWDENRQKNVSSCSFKRHIPAEDLVKVYNGSEAVLNLLSEDQKRFIQEYSQINFPENLISYGPVSAKEWKIKHLRGGEKFKTEIQVWDFDEQMQIKEVSFRSLAADVEADRAFVSEWLVSKEIQLCEKDASKTRATLDYFQK